MHLTTFLHNPDRLEDPKDIHALLERPERRFSVGSAIRNAIILSLVGLIFFPDPRIIPVCVALGTLHEVLRHAIARIEICRVTIDGVSTWSVRGNSADNTTETLNTALEKTSLSACRIEVEPRDITSDLRAPALDDNSDDVRERTRALLARTKSLGWNEDTIPHEMLDGRIVIDTGKKRPNGASALDRGSFLGLINALASRQPVYAVSVTDDRVETHTISVSSTSLDHGRTYKEVLTWTDEHIRYDLRPLSGIEDVFELDGAPGLPDNFLSVDLHANRDVLRLAETYARGFSTKKSTTGFTSSSSHSERKFHTYSSNYEGVETRRIPGGEFARTVPNMQGWQAIGAAMALLATSVWAEGSTQAEIPMPVLACIMIVVSYFLVGLAVISAGVFGAMAHFEPDETSSDTARQISLARGQSKEAQAIDTGISVSDDVADLLDRRGIPRETMEKELKDLVRQRLSLGPRMSPRMRGALIVEMLFVMTACLGVIAFLWPQSGGEQSPIFGTEGNLLALALSAGILGSSILAIGTIQEEALLPAGSAIFIAIYPFLGAGITFVMYTLLRGGVLSVASVSGVDASEVINPYGLVGFSCLVGLFIPKAIYKLNKVSDAIFGADHDPRRLND